jgi:hypothetical protein
MARFLEIHRREGQRMSRSLLAVQNSSAFELIELLLDRVEGNAEIGRDRPTIRFSVVKQVQQSRLRGEAAEQISQKGPFHDRSNRSGNLDLIPDLYERSAIPEMLAQIGFKPAVLVCRRQKGRVDLKKVAVWCRNEGGSAAYKELFQTLSEPEVTP